MKSMITTHFKNKLIKQFDGHFIHYCFIKLLMNLKSSWKAIFFLFLPSFKVNVFCLQLFVFMTFFTWTYLQSNWWIEKSSWKGLKYGLNETDSRQLLILLLTIYNLLWLHLTAVVCVLSCKNSKPSYSRNTLMTEIAPTSSQLSGTQSL